MPFMWHKFLHHSEGQPQLGVAEGSRRHNGSSINNLGESGSNKPYEIFLPATFYHAQQGAVVSATENKCVSFQGSRHFFCLQAEGSTKTQVAALSTIDSSGLASSDLKQRTVLFSSIFAPFLKRKSGPLCF